MQSQISKIIISILITTIIIGGSVYFWQQKNNLASTSTLTLNTTQTQTPKPEEKQPSQNTLLLNDWKKIIQYYCEQSGGVFSENKCTCPSEFGADMYDKNNGQCQTTAGGPGGELGNIMNQCIGLKLQLEECQKK